MQPEVITAWTEVLFQDGRGGEAERLALQLQKIADLSARQPLAVLHAYLHPAAERLARLPHFHDHPVLETARVS
jgi:hypothetical protein